jgi:hypothetical protein
MKINFPILTSASLTTTRRRRGFFLGVYFSVEISLTNSLMLFLQIKH